VSADVKAPPAAGTPSGPDPSGQPTTSAGRSRNPFTRRLPWWGEILIAVAFYWLYDFVQALTGGDAAQAARNGQDVINAEKSLHIWAEPEINRWAAQHHALSLIAGYDYAIAHVLVTGSVLAFLWWRRPRLEVPLRNALVAFSVVALIVYWLYPVAPPRLTDHGLIDILIVHDILGARHVSQGVVNLYAAMPSLHVAWSLWCAAAVVLSFRSRWRHLAWLYPTWTTFVVVSTANHYFLDAAAGAVFAIVPLVFVLRYEARAGWPPP
jgi:hypothetical protein